MFLKKSRKDLIRWALPEASIGFVIKGLQQVYYGCTLECLANESLRGVKYPGYLILRPAR